MKDDPFLFFQERKKLSFWACPLVDIVVPSPGKNSARRKNPRFILELLQRCWNNKMFGQKHKTGPEIATWSVKNKRLWKGFFLGGNVGLIDSFGVPNDVASLRSPYKRHLLPIENGCVGASFHGFSIVEKPAKGVPKRTKIALNIYSTIESMTFCQPWKFLFRKKSGWASEVWKSIFSFGRIPSSQRSQTSWFPTLRLCFLTFSEVLNFVEIWLLSSPQQPNCRF